MTSTLTPCAQSHEKLDAINSSRGKLYTILKANFAISIKISFFLPSSSSLCFNFITKRWAGWWRRRRKTTTKKKRLKVTVSWINLIRLDCNFMMPPPDSWCWASSCCCFVLLQQNWRKEGSLRYDKNGGGFVGQKTKNFNYSSNN